MLISDRLYGVKRCGLPCTVFVPTCDQSYKVPYQSHETGHRSTIVLTFELQQHCSRYFALCRSCETLAVCRDVLLQYARSVKVYSDIRNIMCQIRIVPHQTKDERRALGKYRLNMELASFLILCVAKQICTLSLTCLSTKCLGAHFVLGLTFNP